MPSENHSQHKHVLVFLQVTHNQQDSKNSESLKLFCSLAWIPWDLSSATGMSSENSPDGQTHHSTAPAQATAGDAKLGPVLARSGGPTAPVLLWGKHKLPPPPPSASSQTTHAAKRSHSCLPWLFLVFAFISAVFTSPLAPLPAAIPHTSPQQHPSLCSPSTSRYPSQLRFGYSAPDGMVASMSPAR